MWLLSANQVANQLGKRAGQLYRRIGDCERDAGSVFVSYGTVIEAVVGDRDISPTETSANVGVGAVDDQRQFDAAGSMGGKRSSGPDPHQADLAAVDIAEGIFLQAGQFSAPRDIGHIETEEVTHCFR